MTWWVARITILLVSLAHRDCLAASVSTRCAHRSLQSIDQCTNGNSCYTIWRTNEDDGTFEVIDQGCWDIPCLAEDYCVHDPELKSEIHFNVSICCCRGAMCNQNFSSAIKTEKSQSQEKLALILFVSTVVSFVLILLLIVLKKVLRGRQMKLKFKMDESRDISRSFGFEQKLLTTPDDLGQYRVDAVLHKGSFSTILSMRRETKTGDDSDKMLGKTYGLHQHFDKERDVYQVLGSIDCSAALFLQFHGAYESVSIKEDQLDLLICLELAPLGSVASFLEENTVDWQQLTRMLLQISRGLALLHGGLPLSICHGDLNTSHVLMRNDMSCCISDFSHATILDHNSPISKTRSNNVGSVRYLAPELLAASVGGCMNNFGVAAGGNALKQVDIYCIGHVFWEMSRRCHELYQGVAVPEFELSYHKEIGSSGGLSPSFEQMRQLIAKNKARPLFPEVWKDSNPAIQLLKETMEQSWDDDGEARLTACCIAERFQELHPLWTKYKLVSQGPPSVDKSWLNNTTHRTSTMPIPVKQSFENLKNDNIVSGQRPSIKIQPYQGLNPCLERNFQEDADKGDNDLITGSLKDKQPLITNKMTITTAVPMSSLRPLMSERRNPRIPYLKNNLGVDSPRKNVNADMKA